jgi:hypothetical protein
VRRANLAIVLAVLAVVAVVGLALVGGKSLDDRTGVAARPAAHRADGQMLDAGAPPDGGPRLGAPDPSLAERVSRLAGAVSELRAEVKRLREENARLSSKVDPVSDLLAMLQNQRPQIDAARRRSQETIAVATLRNVTSAQAQMQYSARIDVDRDGTGEYGGFLEMSGANAGRMSSVLVPPVLSSSFRTLDEFGEVLREGYLYRFYLPDAHGSPIGEPPTGFDVTSGVDPDLSETTWCAYAWPAEPGGTHRVFFMNQAGDVLSTEDAAYVGPSNGPAPDAAFQRPGSITGATAVGTTGNDGNVWTQVS